MPKKEKMQLFYTDGGTKNNGQFGKQESVICVADHFGEQFLFEEIGDKTNNEAELTAILRCLQENPSPIKIVSDSKLAVNLVNKKWGTKIHRLKELLYEIWKLDRKYLLTWKPREVNLAGHIIESRLGL